MNTSQRNKCHAIIHTHAAVATTANAGIPIPGVGIIADFAAFTSMTVQLALVFDRSLTDGAAKGIAIAAIKKYLLRAPIAAVAKFIPFANAIASCAIMEGTGWIIASQFDDEYIAGKQSEKIENICKAPEKSEK
ncbi:MAG: hypothetical protein MJ016_01150 [Victivallaceae bacterium]|nr:hypothetical protein [Victivallaceae bacterium]